MSRSIVAKRYAKALFEAAKDENIIDAVEQELTLVVNLIGENSDFQKFLEHPNIENDHKIKVLENTVAEHISPIVFNMLKLIIARGREATLPNLLEYYEAIANAALGQEDAIVYSAYELSMEEIDEVSSKFSNITGKHIKVNVVIDKSILGGLRVRIGDRLYDGSLSHKLLSLEKSLMQKAL